MTPSEIITLFMLMAALAAVPSASVALVVTRAATRGVAHGIAAGAGIVLGGLKVLLFYASLFPQLADVNTLAMGDVLAIVCVTVLAVGGVKLAYALAGVKVAALAGEGRGARSLRRATGVVLLGAGGFLVFKM